MSALIVTFVLNEKTVSARVEAPTSLLDLLHDQLGLSGAKSACEQGECGSCSVLLDDELVCSCLVLAGDVAGSDVTTVEGVSPGSVLNRVQMAMHEAGAVQCGFCTPGIVVAATQLFATNPTPSVVEIKEALAGNICRCTGYGAIIRGLSNLAGQPT